MVNFLKNLNLMPTIPRKIHKLGRCKKYSRRSLICWATHTISTCIIRIPSSRPSIILLLLLPLLRNLYILLLRCRLPLMALALMDLLGWRLLVRIIVLVHLLILTIRRLGLSRGWRWRWWRLILLLSSGSRGLPVLPVPRGLILILITLLRGVVNGTLRSRRLGGWLLPVLLSGLAPLRGRRRRRRRLLVCGLLLLVCWILRWVLLCTGLLVLVCLRIPA